jgi:hypothetical protein
MSGTTIENPGPLPLIAQASQYGLPTFLLMAGGWIVYSGLLVPMRDVVVANISEQTACLRSINEKTQQIDLRTQRLEFNLSRQDPNAWKPSSP